MIRTWPTPGMQLLWLTRHKALVALMLAALLHGLVYALLIPFGQAPDEPQLFEYAALMARLGRVPAVEDRDPELDARIVGALEAHAFGRLRSGSGGAPLADVTQAYYGGVRQVGGDPPLYFGLAALALRLAPGWPLDQQALLLRVLNVLLLPGIVACAYGSALTIDESQPAVAQAAAGLAALQPMLMAIGASVTNDGLANLLGAALCLAALRALRYGLTWRRAALLLLLFLLGLETKRTIVPYLVVLPLLLWWARRGEPGATRSPWRRARWALALAPLALLLGLWARAQVDWQTAAVWFDGRSGLPAARHATEADGAVLKLSAGEEVVQAVSEPGLGLLRNQVLRVEADVWGAVEGRGRLVIYSGDQRKEFPFVSAGRQRVLAHIFVPASAYSLRVGLVADAGWFYADNIAGTSNYLPGNMLLNSSLSLPAPRPGTLLADAVRYLRLQKLAWSIQSGRVTTHLPILMLAGVAFTSFWGEFGWMNVPLVRGSAWLPILGALCLAALAGLCRRVWRERSGRRALLALVALLALGFLTMLLNAYTESTANVQGRYLFPLLVPAALLLAFGLRALAPNRWLPAWLPAWLGFWTVFAGAALVRIVGYYG